MAAGTSLVAGMWEKWLAILSTTFSTMESTNASGNIGEQAVSTLFSGRMTCCSSTVDLLRGRLLVAVGFVEGWRCLGGMTICNSI